MHAVVLEGKVLMLLGEDGLDLLRVLVNRLAHHLDAQVIDPLTVVTAVQLVVARQTVEVDLNKQLGEIGNLPAAKQELRYAVGVEQGFNPDGLHLTAAGAQCYVQRLKH